MRIIDLTLTITMLGPLRRETGYASMSYTSMRNIDLTNA